MLTTDATRRALDFVHRCLIAGDNTPHGLDATLRELAGAFAANGAGLATQEAGGPAIQGQVTIGTGTAPALPWQTDSSLLERIQPGSPARSLAGPHGRNFLVAAWSDCFGRGGWLWLEGTRTWSPDLAGALTLAAQVIGSRWRADDQPNVRWARQLDRQARQRNLELAANVTRRLAHDFGNVMTGILGFAELAMAQNHSGSGTPLHTYLTEAHKAAQNGALFTHQLRLLSRRQGHSSGTIALAPFLADEEKRYRALWGAGVQLTMRADPQVPLLAMDSEQLRQVLGALLENARDAVQGMARGEVTVSARLVALAADDCRDWMGDVRPGPHVEIRVNDNGPGIEPEVARHVFGEPFFSTKTRKRGFGLALAFGVVCGQRGGLDLQSRPEGGAVARVVLPTGSAVAEARKSKVLVVDDDPLILQFVCTTLERAGYQVQKASSAADAFQTYAASAADLVLSDVAMPQETGLDLARRLLTRDADVRMLFMSGQSAVDLDDPAFAPRQFQLLPKPFRTDGLLRAVRDALDRPSRPAADAAASPTKA